MPDLSVVLMDGELLHDYACRVTRERDEARAELSRALTGIDIERTHVIELSTRVNTLRGLLAEARPIIAAHDAIAPSGDTLLMRVNAALEGRDG